MESVRSAHRDHRITPADSGPTASRLPLPSDLFTFCLTSSPPRPILYFFVLAKKQALGFMKEHDEATSLFCPLNPQLALGTEFPITPLEVRMHTPTS